jgi:hypothetical protein
MRREAICKNCGYPVIRLLNGLWIHSDPTWPHFACSVQQAIGYHPTAEPKEENENPIQRKRIRLGQADPGRA